MPTVTHDLSYEQNGINDPVPNGPIGGADRQECQAAADPSRESGHFTDPRACRDRKKMDSCCSMNLFELTAHSRVCPREGPSVRCGGLTEFVRLIALGQAVST